MDLDSYTSPDAEDLLRSAVGRQEESRTDQRALTGNMAAAGLFVLGAAALAEFGHSTRHPSAATWLVMIVAYLIAAQVRFPVAAGWTRPTQIVFVPMLFVLPVALVPAVVMGCMLALFAVKLARRAVTVRLAFVQIADCAFALGPAAVLLISGEQRFAWGHWPIYVLAVTVQIVVDFISAFGRQWLAWRLPPKPLLAMLPWVYATDACLTCAGLLLASSAVNRPGLILLALPLVGLLGLFARERSERIENTLALSTAYRGTAMLLGDVIEDDDEYTGVHSRAVVDTSLAVAVRLGLDATQRRNVEFGALLHDVGKIRVPKEIINKPGKLDDAEWAVMRMHTVYGEEMLTRVGGTLSSVGKVVRHTHERYDGTGYPDGLAGERIPIESRIVCACDALDAMTTNRPYRRGLPLSEAIAELERCSGTHFDPQVIYVLLAEIAERPPVIAPVTAASATVAA